MSHFEVLYAYTKHLGVSAGDFTKNQKKYNYSVEPSDVPLNFGWEILAFGHYATCGSALGRIETARSIPDTMQILVFDLVRAQSECWRLLRVTLELKNSHL
uniref:AlNc14C59G4360 protein n=1 Tax=Albugo laibachii Nc14 TaxID=890382 RepID=F0WCI0_9STRA|nr:AlNc14C59G4360 [Albugo laibachii Nc14]|eukprot:CCA18897.1 AlNc14C59G4360 [Albugo laibachii Nc14]